MINPADALEHTIDRIHRACLTVTTLPPAGPRGAYSTWPAYKLTWWDDEDFGDQRTDEAITRRLISPPRFAATAKEIDDCLPALALLNGFAPPRSIGGSPRLARKCIAMRALQLWYGEHAEPDDEEFAHFRGGWRAIGKLAKCSHTTARKIHAAAMHYAMERVIDPSTNSSAALSRILA